jgi:hypothetical protein
MINVQILVRKPEGKRPVGTLGHRWEDNIKMNLWEMGFESEALINF